MSVWLLAAIALIAVAAVGWAVFAPSIPWDAPPQVKAEENPLSATPESLAAAKPIYDLHCAHCHGERGNGDGPDASGLRVEPTDFTDGLAMKKVTDGELFWRIGAGRRPMPSFQKKLTDQERWELVNYIRAFAQLPPASN